MRMAVVVLSLVGLAVLGACGGKDGDVAAEIATLRQDVADLRAEVEALASVASVPEVAASASPAAMANLVVGVHRECRGGRDAASAVELSGDICDTVGGPGTRIDDNTVVLEHYQVVTVQSATGTTFTVRAPYDQMITMGQPWP